MGEPKPYKVKLLPQHPLGPQRAAAPCEPAAQSCLQAYSKLQLLAPQLKEQPVPVGNYTEIVHQES